MTATGFRPDINGLRAIAVLSVLAYHFGVASLPGGFAGVDVFFVISGYLMTGIILERRRRGVFSLGGFYADRARRIVPALAVLIGTMLVLGAVFLIPTEYLALAKHAAASAAFLSNMTYWLEAGYFDPGASGKWLLHTWSLSVEWQFYMLFPLVMIAALRLLGAARLRALLIGGTLLSYVLVVHLSTTAPRAAFFMLPARAWEMLAGGIVFLSSPLTGRAARVAQIAGLALIVGTVLLVGPDGWPGAVTLVPVVGTALVILAGRTTSRITGNPVMDWVGRNSYSIYLWHWPVAVVVMRAGKTGDWRYVALGGLVSLALGHLSYRFVEKAGRRAGTPSVARPRWWWASQVAMGAPLLLIVAAGAGIWATRGLPQRLPAAVRAVEQDITPGGPYFRSCFAAGRGMPEPCIVGPRHDRAVLTLLGDSHAESAASAVVAALPDPAAGGVAFNGYAACPPLLGVVSTDPESRCAEFVRRYVVPQTRPRTVPLILIAHWQGHFEQPRFRFGGAEASAAAMPREIVRTMCALSAAGPTYAVMPTPDFGIKVARELQYRLWRDPHAPDIGLPVAAHLARTRTVRSALQTAARTCGLKLLDPLPLLCPGGVCRATQAGRAIFRNEDHLSEYGNKLLVPMFRTVTPSP